MAVDRQMTDHARRVLRWAAYAWAVGNCGYVYLLAGGSRTYRVEAASLLFAAILLLSLTSPPRAIARVPWRRPQTASLLIVAALLWLFVLMPEIRFPFLNDDYVFLDRYRTARDVLNSPYFFRPLFAWLFWLARIVGHDSPVPFHLLGLSLHAASAGCVYGLARRLLSSPTAATIAAAVFLLNPLQLEVSLWTSGLQDGLWTSCILGAALVYRWRVVLSIGHVVVTALLVAAALVSKETAVCFILILPLLDVLFGSHRGPLRRVAYAVFVAELVAYLWVRSYFAAVVDHQLLATPTRYVVKQFVTTPYRVFVFPWNAAAAHVPLLLQCAIAVIALTALLGAVRRPVPTLLIGPALILASTLPLAGYFYVGPDLTAARYLYFGAAGWAMFVGEAFDRCVSNPTVRFTCAAVTVVLLFVALSVNIRPWRAAAELVRNLDTALTSGRQPADAVREWRIRHDPGGSLNSLGVPDSYQGVYLFVNGYPEYLRWRAAR